MLQPQEVSQFEIFLNKASGDIAEEAKQLYKLKDADQRKITGLLAIEKNKRSVKAAENYSKISSDPYLPNCEGEQRKGVGGKTNSFLKRLFIMPAGLLFKCGFCGKVSL